ncbi:caprolactamase subunit alpha [Verminephrobacter eiseniae]|uniref:5-oxoprolinase (ATP-hydrolyzing) n=1 Tax=Verminephrobacter eiseniae (strain EF01-2) TaxID=391735 RepID=A1WI22_VEREI|nr:hydantoinase/oxoprolinase family protein [Verminephrobacter eiseniae]ABM57279.1 5-oxoprolinase (ATP-hydrolyzing) [Verminephrobacter eiseniae EF01-2]MCW5282908.1 hydantoinase/oxoprolinase family protein [Verminephrobacter eiseniae]MCW5303224.1 hydantoinase/oxoprolinase family protein [Verminephrobacter eiseniae]MCW8178955.1 hydantoinase/oxoprolinase family protein [Verminephrobacter eiseniae]MCW8189360.1 hydantoinase/oxoprolinase family protein [Verminephrobacter eiseniae]
MNYRLGVDAGGTFTDFVLADGSGNVHLFKTTSTPEDGTRAIAEGLAQIAQKLGLPIADILGQTELCVNGTTVGLNALIQHQGVKTGLICTAGHEDSLEIRLGHKEEGYRYDDAYPPAQILVERHLRVPVRERVLSDGTVHTPLDEQDVRNACESFRREGVQAVAVSFLWSVANDEHERRAAQIVRELLPEAYVSVGIEVFPQMREYTRTSTAVLNAYLGPVLGAYATRIDKFFQDSGLRVPVRYFQSNGGMASRAVMVARAVNAINSGPASAPMAGRHIAQPLGLANFITVDMGGTSFDITLTHQGQTQVTKDNDFLRYRIGTPMIQVESLGAGGGSIGWIDSMGLLNVGPQSAGASPGPACYMRGGTRPTVTDANVALGYLNPQALLGGRLAIDAAASRQAIATQLAGPLGITPEKAAYGIFSIVNNNMVNGIRRVSIERGYDPRDFALIGAGGATALHITALAREIGIRTVLVPKLASGLCAFGQILSDVKYDYMASAPMRLDERADIALLEQRFAALERQGAAVLHQEGIARERIAFRRSLDMRYVGQVHECPVDIGTLALGAASLAAIKTAFHQMHRQLFTYDEPDSLIEIVNIETTVLGKTEPLRLAQWPRGGQPSAAIRTHRPMVFGADAAALQTPVYDGTRLGADDLIDGPAVIEEPTTTIVLQSGWQARLDASGCYVLSAQQ